MDDFILFKLYKRGIFMLNTDNAPNKNTNPNDIIVADDIGVYFNVGQKQDDFKSRLLNVFKKEEAQDNEVKTIWPLTSINFTGHKGEILGIIGSNGAGKTTLSKIITGI